MVLSANMGQFQQVAAFVVAVGLPIVADRRRVDAANGLRSLVGGARLPPGGFGHLIETVVPETAGGLDTLVGEVARSEERSVGTECVSQCTSWWSQDP